MQDTSCVAEHIVCLLSMDMKFLMKIFNAIANYIDIFNGIAIGLPHIHQSMDTSVRPKSLPGDYH